MLTDYRLSPAEFDAKALVLGHPFRFVEADGYLIGYLLVKRLWSRFSVHSERPISSTLFFMYVHAAIFDNCMVAASVASPLPASAPSRRRRWTRITHSLGVFRHHMALA